MESVPQKQYYKISVPNSTAVLVLGIVSILFCCAYGIIGLANGIIALILSSKGKEAYEQDPSLYTISSYTNLKAGRVCAIIGTCLSSLALLFYVIYFAILGTYLGLILAILGIVSQGG